MMHDLRRYILFLFLLFMVGTSWAVRETVDRIVAVVGDDVILESELTREVYLYYIQFGVEIEDEAQLEELRSSVLERMIESRILLAEAKRDTIEPSETEVEEALNQAIKEISGRFPSEEAFEEEVLQQGLTVDDLRARYREDIRERLLVDGLVERRLRPGVFVSSREVEEFYQSHIDSIPLVPAKVTLSHIMIAVVPGEEMEKAAKERAEAILALVKEGQDFAMLARRFSEDPGSAPQGGDLGYFGRGEMVPEFETAAFDLQPGEVSGLVQTVFGYHILKCEEKEADRVRISHILVLLLPGPEDAARARARADSVRTMALAEESFASLAGRYSDDAESRDRGGVLGEFVVDDLGQFLRDAIEGLGPGEISDIVESDIGYHVVRVDAYEASRRPTYDEIKGSLKEFLFQTKLEEKSKGWIEELKEEIYVENRLAESVVEREEEDEGPALEPPGEGGELGRE
jgi:peptidyl-prolyl cis-trans isomerase SurA